MDFQLSGLRALVIEDEPIIVEEILEILASLGCETAGVGGTVPDALTIAQECACDFAILDVTLNGKRTDAVAAALAARGIPIVVATGGSPAGLPDTEAVVIYKPYNEQNLTLAISAAMSRKA